MSDHGGRRAAHDDVAESPSVGRTVELVVLRWEAVAADPGFRPARLGRRVEALCDLGVDVAVVADADPRTVEDALAARPSGHGRLHLRPRAGGGLDAALLDADARGVGSGLALLLLAHADAPDLTSAGHERAVVRWVDSEGGAVTVLRLLAEQCDRRRRGRVPAVDEDPAWTLREEANAPGTRGAVDAVLTLAAGGLGTRGAVEEPGPDSAPMVLAAGVYSGRGPAQQLRPGPEWTGLVLSPPPRDAVRILDLRTGVLLREEPAGAPPLRTLRFVSIVRPGLAALRAEGPAAGLHPGPALRAPDQQAADSGTDGDRQWVRVPAAAPPDDPAGAIVAVAVQRTGGTTSIRTVERTAQFAAGRRPTVTDSARTLDQARAAGFDHVLSEHRAAWAERWDDVDVRIPDDPAAQLALRFVLFQLWGAAGDGDELAVGARGLSGTGYAGHVFWDADVFVLPALVSIDPSAARAMVRYRIARLPAAREEARRRGRRGARFPWESAVGGEDVTPTSGLVGGDTVPIRTGDLEEHITADVAWAAVHYARWARDPGFLTGAACPLLLDTARYWASRVRVDAAGRGHVDDVIGPDEYHEHVDDNAYTNVMARWNLRAAAELAERTSPAAPHGLVDEPARWRDLADRIVELRDPVTGVHEQFVGYHRLEPLRLADVGTGPVAADALLGRKRASGSQLIKQPDVLMLHHLVPDEVPGSLDADLDFYGPRTTHGSSLSPAAMAALLARAGRTVEALAMLRLVLDLDRCDLTGKTAAGLHMAALGGAWQAVLHGFAGVSVAGTTLCVDPHLPDEWPSLEIRFRCLDRRIRLDMGPETIRLSTDRPVAVRIGTGPTRWVRRVLEAPRVDPPNPCRPSASTEPGTPPTCPSTDRKNT